MQDGKSLENQWNDRACPWRLHHSFAITGEGVALGADTLIAPAVKGAYGRTALAIDGNEERILALLSVAYDRPVSPAVLDNFRAASRALAKGNKSLALICLAQSGLPALNGWDRERNARGAAKALFMADRVLQNGIDAGTLLKGLGLLPDGLSPAEWRVLAKYNDNHDERGRFASGPSAGGSASIPFPIFPNLRYPMPVGTRIMPATQRVPTTSPKSSIRTIFGISTAPQTRCRDRHPLNPSSTVKCSPPKGE